MSIMREEILATPELLKEAIKVYEPIVKKLADQIDANDYRNIYIVGRGTSNNAALYFQYLCDVLTGISCKMLQPSIITLMSGKPTLENGVFLAVSQGGRGEDIRRLAEYAKSKDICTIAVTNESDSPLSQISDISIPLSMGLEKSMAATKTFSAELMALAMLAYELAGKQTESLLDVPALFAEALEISQATINQWKHYKDSKNCYVLARGALLPVAKELCCKLQETCLINANAYSAADFLHGPFSLIEPGVQVILFHRDDETGPCTEDMYQRLLANGAEVTVFTDSKEFAADKEYAICLPESDWTLAPFCFTAASQMLACHLADLRGTDPDLSRNLLKYTITI